VRITSLLILALAAGSLAAQDAVTDRRLQLFLEYSAPTEITMAPGTKDKPKAQTGVGFRFLGEIAGAPGLYYELGGMFDSSSTFRFNGTTSGGTLDLTNAKLTNSYWSVGAAYLWKLGASGSFGLHLEGRGEFLRLQGEAAGTYLATTPQSLDHSTTYLRPWLRASADVTFAAGKPVRPFVGLDGSFALLKTGQTRVPDYTDLDDRTVKSLAPRYSGSVYAGVRF
jgi:hypothetical protein